MKNRFLIFASCLLAAFLAFGCEENPAGPDNHDVVFQVSPETLEFDFTASTKTVSVNGGGEWYVVTPGENWCNAEKDGSRIVVSVTENTSKNERICNLPISHDDYQVYYLKITQSGRDSDPSRPAVPEGGYTLGENVVMEEDDVNSLLMGCGGTSAWDMFFSLKKPVPEGKLPQAGQSLIFSKPSGTFPNGCLAFVQEVQDKGDHYEVRYTDAGLTSCFRDLNLPEQELDIASYVTRIEDGEGHKLNFTPATKAAGKSEPFEIKIYPGSISLGDNIEIEPTVNLSLVLKSRIDIDDYKLYSLDFVVDADCSLEVGCSIGASFDTSVHMPVMNVYFAAIPVGPVLITPSISVVLNISSGVGGSISATFEYSRHIRAAAHYDYLNSWSSDLSSSNQDDSGWAPKEVGPNLEGTVNYGVEIGPKIGIYGDLVSVGMGISAMMEHSLSGSPHWGTDNWVSVLADTEFSSSFNLGMYMSAEGLGFPMSINSPGIEFPLTSYKIIPTVSSTEFDCDGTSLTARAWLKNKHLLSLPMSINVNTGSVGGVFQNEVNAVINNAEQILKQLNAGADSVAVEATLSLKENMNYAGRVLMDFGPLGWQEVKKLNGQVITVSKECSDAFREILDDIYACRSGEWKGCNWADRTVPLGRLSNVSASGGVFKITIPREWKFSSKVKVDDHTGKLSDFKTWELWANDGDNRSFSSVTVEDKCCKSFFVSDNVDSYTMKSQKLEKLSLPENVKSADFSGTPFTSVSVEMTLCEKLESIKFDNCPKLAKISVYGPKDGKLKAPAISVTGSSALSDLYFDGVVLANGVFDNIVLPSGFKNLTMEQSNLSLTSINVQAPLLNLYSCTCGDLSLSGCAGMKEVFMSLDKAGSISVSQCQSLQTLRVGWNISSLSVTNCQSLTSLTCRETNMTSFEASSLPSLTTLDCYGNKNLTGVMLPIFDEVRAKPGSALSYDQRYTYSYDGTWTDKGYGYYYDGEPDRGYHRK